MGGWTVVRHSSTRRGHESLRSETVRWSSRSPALYGLSVRSRRFVARQRHVSQDVLHPTTHSTTTPSQQHQRPWSGSQQAAVTGTCGRRLRGSFSAGLWSPPPPPPPSDAALRTSRTSSRRDASVHHGQQPPCVTDSSLRDRRSVLTENAARCSRQRTRIVHESVSVPGF